MHPTTDPLEILEAALDTPPNDSDDIVVIKAAITARFSDDYENEPIGDEVLDAIWAFIDRE
jgi:hypothetical protein